MVGIQNVISPILKSLGSERTVYIYQEWNDVSLQWDPKEYGGIRTLELPSENIWLPDIVLFNK